MAYRKSKEARPAWVHAATTQVILRQFNSWLSMEGYAEEDDSNVTAIDAGYCLDAPESVPTGAASEHPYSRR